MLKNNVSNNNILYILLGILFLIIFTKNIGKLKTNYNKFLNIKINLDNKEYSFNAFLDTGNKLIDPILKLPVIIVKNDLFNIKGTYLVPYKTVDKESILECFKVNNLYINNKFVNKKFLIGLSNNINIDGVDCIFNEELMEEI